MNTYRKISSRLSSSNFLILKGTGSMRAMSMGIDLETGTVFLSSVRGSRTRGSVVVYPSEG